MSAPSQHSPFQERSTSYLLHAYQINLDILINALDQSGRVRKSSVKSTFWVLRFELDFKKGP